MGIQDRKKRQFAQREQIFLDCAWDMLEREGALNLQMAKLAAESEYSVGTLYMHFASKEDLLLALATRTVAQRGLLYEQAVAWQAPSRHRMLAIVVADLLFALSAPVSIRLAQYVATHTVWAAASSERQSLAMTASEPLVAAVQQVADAAIATGDVHSADLNSRELCTGIWAMTQGMHTLTSADDLFEQHTLPRPYRLLLRHIHALLNGLGWQSIVAIDDSEAQQEILNTILLEVFPEQSVASELLAHQLLTS